MLQSQSSSPPSFYLQHIFSNRLYTILSVLPVLPLLFLFGGLTNNKDSSNSGGDSGRQEHTSSSNKLPSARLPSISPNSSATRLAEKPGTKIKSFFPFPLCLSLIFFVSF